MATPPEEGLDIIGCPGLWVVAIGHQMALGRPLVGAYLCKYLCGPLFPPLPPSAVGLRVLRGGNGGCQCDCSQELSHSLRMEARDCFVGSLGFSANLLALCFWVGYLTSLRHCFLSYKMEP